MSETDIGNITAESADRAEWEADAAFFDAQLSRLLADARYKGQYVAVCRQAIVDSDSDEIRLARRMFERFGNEVMYIAKVEEPAAEVELPSPELGR